jgi:hypothetical protein
MKQIAFTLILIGLLASDNIFAQNLVPNPSFEDTIQCPISGSLLNTQQWSIGGGTPDYYHSCVPTQTGGLSSFNVPSNTAGYQQAVSGNAYAGLITLSGPTNYNLREYIQVKLTDTLKAGLCYTVAFYFSSANMDPNGNFTFANSVVKGLGIQFSDNPFTGSGAGYNLMPINPNYYLEDTTLVNSLDTVNWSLFSKEYTANGTELYITIGNYRTNNNTPHFEDGSVDTLWSGIYPTAYNFIDDVSVMLCEEFGTYNCIENSCIDPTDGSGIFNSLTACQDSCGITGLQEQNKIKKLLRIVDAFGLECAANPNKILFYIYSDGTVEKRIVIE